VHEDVENEWASKLECERNASARRVRSRRELIRELEKVKKVIRRQNEIIFIFHRRQGRMAALAPLHWCHVSN